MVKVGRIAGQYAKPRSSGEETRNGVTLPSYRGDAVNGLEFTEESRIPDPQRLRGVYNAAAATLNLTRAFTTGGYADLHQVHAWNTDFVKSSPVGRRYEQLASEIERALAFMRACGATADEFRTVDFYASHEALILEYEHALTRIDSRTEQPYDVSGHLLWVGERTRQLDGAHVEFLASLSNPLGVKIGPTTTPEYIRALIDKLNPKGDRGPADLHHPDGRGQDPRRAAAAAGGGPRPRLADRVGVRPDARQHVRDAERVQDPQLRRRDRRGAGLLRRARAGRDLAGRHAHRAHRRRRDRVPGRRRGVGRGGPGQPVRDRLRPAARTGTSRSNWRSWSPSGSRAAKA